MYLVGADAGERVDDLAHFAEAADADDDGIAPLVTDDARRLIGWDVGLAGLASEDLRVAVRV